MMNNFTYRRFTNVWIEAMVLFKVTICLTYRQFCLKSQEFYRKVSSSKAGCQTVFAPDLGPIT